MRAGWMRPSDDQPLDRQLGNLAPVRIEAGEDDRARRVVDDEIDAGGHLKSTNVPAFPADDAPFEVVARQVDNGHRRLDGVLGRAALNGLRDVMLGAIGGGFTSFRVEPLEQVGGVVACLALNLFEQQFLRLFGCQAGDALELVLLLRNEPLVL